MPKKSMWPSFGSTCLAGSESGSAAGHAESARQLYESRLGDIAPDFEANSTEGVMRFHEWIGDSWVVQFSHPKDFTPVCTTELGDLATRKAEFLVYPMTTGRNFDEVLRVIDSRNLRNLARTEALSADRPTAGRLTLRSRS
jgi:alkyl hydroperoxide reductase subunit AhpC